MMQPPATLPVSSNDMADIDTILHQAITSGDPLIATEYGNKLIATVRLKGVSLAKLFFGLKSNWQLFQVAGIEEEFVDFVDAHMQFDGRTADKYADMYKNVLENETIPIEIREQLKLKSIQTLLLLTAAVREGDLGPDDLENVVVLDHNRVQRMVRHLRGDVTNSRTAVFARLISQQGRPYPAGSLVVYGSDENGNPEVESIGFFNLTPNTASGRKFLARMIRKMDLEEANNGESKN